MENDSFAADRTACMNPPAGWNPDAEAARQRFRARREAAGRPFAATRWALAAAVAAGAILLLPSARVGAQQLWQMLTVRQVAFIRVNPWPAGVPSPRIKLLGIILPPIPARDVDDVRWRVHYEPRLPRAGVLQGSPRLYTNFGLSAGTVVKTADLTLALRKAGVTDGTVPAQWDGAQLALHTGAIVLAEWPDIALAQSLPPKLSVPPGFDFAAWSALVLRVLGVPPDEALRLARRTGTIPPWLAPVSRDLDANATIEEIELNTGPATLLRNAPGYNGTKLHTIVWSVTDRVYVLSGNLDRDLTIAAANAIQ